MEDSYFLLLARSSVARLSETAYQNISAFPVAENDTVRYWHIEPGYPALARHSNCCWSDTCVATSFARSTVCHFTSP